MKVLEDMGLGMGDEGPGVALLLKGPRGNVWVGRGGDSLV